MPLILTQHERAIHLFMKFQLKKSGCIPIAVNGMHDHVHLLFAMNYQISLMDLIKQVKGSTSHMINQKKLCQGKFSWQDGFAAFSVSQSKVRDVVSYIGRQKEHHARKTFVQEWEAFEQAHAYMWEKQQMDGGEDTLATD
jgi:putative transposase